MVFGPRHVVAIVLIVVALVVGVVFALSCGGGDGGESPQTTPEVSPTAQASGPETPLAAFAAQKDASKPYIGDCSKAQNAGTDAGKLCTLKRGERNGQEAYVLGPTFSEPTDWVIVGQVNNQWVIQKSVALTADTRAVPGIPWPLAQGAEVVVAGTGTQGLNVREGPGTGQRAVDSLKDGTKITLAAGPVVADGYEWWQVQGRSGWVASDYLRYPDAAQ